MNPEIKELWISALRSGDYVQGEGSLNYQGKFCCLGVLCDLAAKVGAVTEEDFGRGGRAYGGAFFELPRAVQDWSGLNSLNGTLNTVIYAPNFGEGPSVLHNTLAGLNDLARYSFNQIADVIEEQF